MKAYNKYLLKERRKPIYIVAFLAIISVFWSLNYLMYNPLTICNVFPDQGTLQTKNVDTISTLTSTLDPQKTLDDVSINDLVNALKQELYQGSTPNNEEQMIAKVALIAGKIIEGNDKEHSKDEDIEKLEIINAKVTNENKFVQIDDQLTQVDSNRFLSGDEHVKHFFSQILRLMSDNRLSFPLEQRMNVVDGRSVISPVHLFNDHKANLSEDRLKRLFKFPQEFIDDVKEKHQKVTDNLPTFNPNFYEGKGYVMVGGGKYTWLSMLSIEVLRSVGSTLPVEVFLPTEEDYEEEFCQVVLPKYNARCIKVSNVFDMELLNQMDVSGYQYKSLALLSSSFEHAFMLDSDNYPVTNPDILFESELYNNYTMITWPDYWRRTTSPLYYEVTNTKIGNQTRFLDDDHTDPNCFKKPTDHKFRGLREQFHNREGTIRDWSTESGQMLINKKIHFKALLLALYYNLEGKFGFYPLLSQGGAGEGDKETFVAASHFYGLTYYQVHKSPDRAYGFYRVNTGVMDTTIIQYDPIRDFELFRYANRIIDAEIELQKDQFRYDYVQQYQQKINVEQSRPMFYHVHDPKMDPFKIYLEKSSYGPQEQKVRNLGGDFPRFGFDLETFLWTKIDEHLCIGKTKIGFFTGTTGELVDYMCSTFIPDQLQFLKSTQQQVIDQYNFKSPYKNMQRHQFDAAQNKQQPPSLVSSNQVTNPDSPAS